MNSIKEPMLRAALVASLLAASLGLNSAAFALDIIATIDRAGANGDAGSASDIETVIRLGKATNVRPVFSPDERRMLVSAGRGRLSEAKKFTILSERALIELNATILRKRLPVRLEPAEIEFQLDGPTPLQVTLHSKEATRGASFENLQWAIKNIGQKVPITIDDHSSLLVFGKPGEDTGLDRAPNESQDPKRQITIAVLDTGIDFGHPELLDRVVENTVECRAIAELTKCLKDSANLPEVGDKAKAKATCNSKYLGKDFDGNGYPLDCSGWNVTTRSAIGDNVWGDADASDKIGHGTHVAGVIAARSDNDDGIRGVMDNVRILPVKVIISAPTAPVRVKEVAVSGLRVDLTGVPSPLESSIKTERGLGDLVARGLLYAIRSRAQIVNMSLGWPVDVDSPLMSQMIELARSRGILLVAAAGNDGTDALIRPCVFDGMICVASHDPDGAISHFSNYGAGVDIAAPGLNILSLFPTSLNSPVFRDRIGYELKSGTSMAAPYISALLGKLLNSGFSPEEARARLLIGARPVTVNTRVDRAHAMLVQTGNADLGRAFKASPQPLILPTSKRPIEIKWDRKGRNVGFRLELENSWTDAKSIRVEFKLPGQPARDARISPATLTAENWQNGESRSFGLHLEILSERLESDFTVEMVVTAVDAKTGHTSIDRRYLAVELVATPRADDPEIETRKILGSTELLSALPTSDLRSVSSLDGRNEQDYLSMTATDTTLRVSLIAEEKKGYRFRGSVELPTVAGILRLIHRVDVDSNGSSDYVMIWKVDPTAQKRVPTFFFKFFDQEFKPLTITMDGKRAAEFEYSTATSVITDSLQWISVGKQKVPAWVTRGMTPELEKKPYDPWNPNPRDLPDFRVYVLSERGLVTVPIGDKFPVDFFPTSREEMISGDRRLMWMGGNGTDVTYSMSTLKNLISGPLVDLNVGGYRRVRSTMMSPILALSPAGTPDAGETIGVGVFSDSYRSALRVTGLIPNQGSDQELLFDKILTPQATVDSVNSVLASFMGERNVSSIAQTIYEMQYDDLRSGERASATLRRFSFMPELYFEKFYRAVIGENSQNELERLPMVYLAQGLGTGSSLEVIAPRYESGKLLGFIRPARLRLTAPSGCQSMGNPIAASSTSPTRVVFICADRVIQVPLRY